MTNAIPTIYRLEKFTISLVAASCCLAGVAWIVMYHAGLELLQQVRMVYPDLPFMMAAGNSELASVRAANQFDVSAYIRKRYSPQQFRGKMVALLNKICTGSMRSRDRPNSLARSWRSWSIFCCFSAAC